MANEALKAKLNKAMAEAVKSQLNGDKDHGWGQTDSMNAIEQLIMDCHEEIGKEKCAPLELLAFINDLVNPSAFRQKLENKGLLNKKVGRAAKNEEYFTMLTE